MTSHFVMTNKDTSWWVFALPAFLGSKTLFDSCVLLYLALAVFSFGLLSWAFTTGGIAWKDGRNRRGPTPIPGPRGLPIFGSLFTLSRGLAHRALASEAWSRAAPARQLMALSLGSTPLVVASDPHTARELLTSPHLADRPLKMSARSLMFERAIGFAPSGSYWRLLRRIASTHLFSPRRILAHEPARRLECAAMLRNIARDKTLNDGGVVSSLRKHLQAASLNDVMGSVFGKRYDTWQDDSGREVEEVRDMVREGFDLLGSFNWSDHLPWLSGLYDPLRVARRCERLVPRVRRLVRAIIEDHRAAKKPALCDDHDFVDVLLSLDGDEKLNDDDIIAVLWEMIFRGTDTTALLTEWAMAELVLNPQKQAKLRAEINAAAGDGREMTDAELASLPYLQAVLKETLRAHPPGPLLSWARLATSDVQLSNGMVVPAQTTAMVNMWAITHDPANWPDPTTFCPERFIEADIDVRGSDLRLAPFGAGRRVCPGKNLGLVVVSRWVAELVRSFEWAEDPARPVDLTELLKLSCEMKNPLSVVAKQIRAF